MKDTPEDMSDQEKIECLRKQVLDLESKLNSLKRQLSMKDRVLHQKNLALDAYHHVWCDGTCESGIHRYHDAPLTLEMVQKAEYNTRRLRTKFDNLTSKVVWAKLSEEEKAKIQEECYVTKIRDWQDVVHELQERFKDLEI